MAMFTLRDLAKDRYSYNKCQKEVVELEKQTAAFSRMIEGVDCHSIELLMSCYTRLDNYRNRAYEKDM